MKKLKQDKSRNQKTDVKKTDNSDEPKVFKIATTNRREFLQTFAKGAIGIAGLVTLTKLLESCEDTMDIEALKNQADNTCSCHVVCTCDKHDNTHDSEYTSQYDSNKVCTCNQVCTCNSVCTCDTESSSYTYVYYY